MRSLFWLPLWLLWTVVKAVAVPAGAVAVAWWLLPDRWAQAVTLVALVYLVGVAVVAGASLRGQVISRARGTYTIRGDAGRWDR